jgi:hypothetical protein
MLAVEAAAQAHLRDVVRALNALRYQLLGLAATLPDIDPGEPGEPEEPGEGEGPVDPAADLRTAIDCILADRILPAITELAGAAGLLPKEP